MTHAPTRDMARPDTLALFPDGQAQIVWIGTTEYTRYTLRPGFRWSANNVVMNGDALCQSRHSGYVLSGRFAFAPGGGTPVEVAAGEAYSCPPDHDKWTVGDEPCVLLEIAVRRS